MILNAKAENGSLSFALRVTGCSVVGIHALGLRRIQRRGQIVHDRIEQRLHALVLESRAQHDREQLQSDGRLAQRAPQLVAVISSPSRNLCRISSSFSATVSTNWVMECFGFLLQFGRNCFRNVFRAHGLVIPNDGLHVDQVNHAPELIFLADWNLDRDGLGIEALADGIDGVLKISTHLVDLVDEANSRNTVFISLAPDFFRLRLHPMHGVEHRDRAVQHTQRALHLRREVDVAGRVDDVNANIAPHTGGRRGRNRDAAFLLLLHPVHRGRAFMDLSDAVRPSRVEKDALRRSGLAGVDVSHDADVSATL